MIFSEQADALLREWLTSPTWHVDKPSENAKFYRFAAALMQEAGQPDIREVRGTLEEAAREWATGYETRGGDRRVDILCERLQVLYDFFSALRAAETSMLPPPAAPPRPAAIPMPRQPSPVAPAAPPPAPLSPAVQELSVDETATQATDVASQQPPRKEAKARKGQDARQARVDQTEEYDGPSRSRWQQFWPEVMRLHDLLLQRRGQPSPPPIPLKDTEAIGAEMARRAGEVLRAEEITGAEKRNLIGRVIEKVILPDKNAEGATVTVKWLK